MAFFTVKLDEESVKDYSSDNSKYINASGIYEVIIKSVIVNESPNGGQALDLWIEYQGQEQPLFRAIPMRNNDGSDSINQNMLNKLAGVVGAASGGQISDPVSRMVPIGKGGEEKECMVLADFDDSPVHVRIQIEYGMYEGKVQQRKNVRNFFRYEDKATAAEIVNDTEKGKQYALEEAYSGKDSYRDGLSVEDVQNWIKNRKSGTKEEPKKPSSGFGGKRFGNSK